MLRLGVGLRVGLLCNDTLRNTRGDERGVVEECHLIE